MTKPKTPREDLLDRATRLLGAETDVEARAFIQSTGVTFTGAKPGGQEPPPDGVP